MRRSSKTLLTLEESGHMFPTFRFCHLNIALYLQKPSLGSSGNQEKKSVLLTQTAFCFQHMGPLWGPARQLPLLSFSHTPDVSHPALYRHVQVLLIQTTDPGFLVQKFGGQTSCGNQNISDFRNRLSHHTIYYKLPVGPGPASHTQTHSCFGSEMYGYSDQVE